MKKAKSLIKYLTLISMLFLFLGLAACKNGGVGAVCPHLKLPKTFIFPLTKQLTEKRNLLLIGIRLKTLMSTE